MKSLYYVNTGYHLILCSCIAYANKNEKSFIILRPGFKGWRNVVESLKNSFDLFEEYIVLRPKIGSSSPLKRHYNKSINSWRCLNILRTIRPDKIWTCKDGTPVSKTLINNCKKTCECIYVEDGAFSYGSNVVSTNGFLKRYVKKIIYGPWYKRVKVHGTSKEISKIASIYPNKVRPELSHLKKHKINPCFIKKWGGKWMEGIINEELKENLKSIDTLLILRKMSGQNFDKNYYLKLMQEFTESQIDENQKVGLKYHPAEQMGDYLNINNNVLKVPRNIPAELLFIVSEKLNLIVGHTTTALITAKWLSDTVNVVSTAQKMESKSNRLTQVMKDVGVDMV